MGVEYIHLTGGEPFLYESLGEVFRLAAGEKIPLTFSSNGSLLLEKESLLATHRKGIRTVNISLDSARRSVHEEVRGSGSFQDALKGAALCRRLNIPFGLNACLNRLNADRFPEVVFLAKRLGASHVNFTTVLPCANAQENDLVLGRQERQGLLNRLQAFRRSQGNFFWKRLSVPVFLSEALVASAHLVMCANQSQRAVTIDVDGSVHFCCFLTVYGVEPSVERRLRICSLANVSFDEGLEMFQETMHRFLQERTRDFTGPACADDLDFNSCFYCSKKLGISCPQSRDA